MRLTVQEASDCFSSLNESFQLHEATEISYVQDERANDMMKERVKCIMNQIVEHLESSKVQQLLMPHIEGVMLNVLKQCESLQPSSLDKIKPMPQGHYVQCCRKDPNPSSANEQTWETQESAYAT